MDLTKINIFKPDMILGKYELTTEMREWLEENLEGKYVIRPNIFRFKYAGPRVPLKDCQRQEGHKLFFESNEDIVAFKLRWL